jgi:hypothetical protein
MKKLNVRTERRSVLAIALFVFAVFFVALQQQAKAQYQPPDSCLDLVYPVEDSVHSNYDSVMIDTC